MDGHLLFLNLEGLDDTQVKHLNGLLHPSNLNPAIEFPWNNSENKCSTKGTVSSLNVHAPVFHITSKISNHDVVNNPYSSEAISFNNVGSQILHNSLPVMNYTHDYSAANSRREVLPAPVPYSIPNSVRQQTYDTYNESVNCHREPPKTVNGVLPVKIKIVQRPPETFVSTSTFKLNPTVSCFVPSNFQNQIAASDSTHISAAEPKEDVCKKEESEVVSDIEDNSNEEGEESSPEIEVLAQEIKQNGVGQKEEDNSQADETKPVQEPVKSEQLPITPSAPRSWADIVSRGQSSGKTQLATNKPIIANGNKEVKVSLKAPEQENLSVEEDKLALVLGKYLHQFNHSFEPVFLQPRGLINRRNWCYVNATLQALLACPPFYSLLQNLPLSQGVERGKSATPVTDSMVKLAQEFQQFESPREELTPGQPFRPDFIYDMLKDLKSDCLKGQQEDAEEFLSFILNGMHEEMVKIMKNYEKKNHINMNSETKENGDASESEEEWQVIGSKHKGMVTRKVAEHKTPISDLLGGQIKSFLTTSGNKTSASIQPFFTLQLDIQSEKVTSVSEALKEMTVKEPIQGYTCAKTKQEVEAYSHVALQKLPPILILHLKRIVYNKNGGCKKVLKKTDYPIELELSKELFSSDVKKNQRIRMYKLFAVMYHDGEEAIKGHYISDVYNHGSQTWIRCDDRTISVVPEELVLSPSPPRVPYLLFYQES